MESRQGIRWRSRGRRCVSKQLVILTVHHQATWIDFFLESALSCRAGHNGHLRGPSQRGRLDTLYAPRLAGIDACGPSQPPRRHALLHRPHRTGVTLSSTAYRSRCRPVATAVDCRCLARTQAAWNFERGSYRKLYIVMKDARWLDSYTKLARLDQRSEKKRATSLV